VEARECDSKNNECQNLLKKLNRKEFDRGCGLNIR
jgi:hypothetical protein